MQRSEQEELRRFLNLLPEQEPSPDLQSLLSRPAPPIHDKEKCANCGKKIPPGRAGRKCEECRGEAAV